MESYENRYANSEHVTFVPSIPQKLIRVESTVRQYQDSVAREMQANQKKHTNKLTFPMACENNMSARLFDNTVITAFVLLRSTCCLTSHVNKSIKN